MVVPRLGVTWQLQPLAYATATATWDPSCICNLHHNVVSLTHWVRQGIEPASSWILVRFISTAVQQELRKSMFWILIWFLGSTFQSFDILSLYWSHGLCYFILFLFLGLHPQHMEVPRCGVKSELPLPAYITPTATLDPCCICDLHHCSWQCRILNPLSKAREWTCILIDTNWVC